jgi:hypothetical protein
MLRTNVAAALITILVVLAACTAGAPSSEATTTSSSAIPLGSPTSFPAALQSGEPYAPIIDPANFVRHVDNAFFPLVPGTRWVMKGEGESAGEVTVTKVTTDTKTILGVVCTVVRDEVDADGELQELTLDWYAQDADGNVWYFGEDTAEYKNGQVTTRAGAWEAGVDGAQPGIIMPAEPIVGLTYRQELLAGEAEDMAKAVKLGASADTPVGSYTDVLVTEDWTPLEPGVVERKFYAPGVGLVMERGISGGQSLSRLTEFSPPR